MHQFKDSEGREWRISLNGWQMKKIQERLGHKCRDPQAALGVYEDQPLLCDLLLVLCEDQIKECGLSPQAFQESLDGDAMDDATEAYVNESIPFIPRQFRTIVADALTKAKQAQEMATKELTETMDEEITKAMNQARHRSDAPGTTTGNASGSGRASLA